MCGAVNSMISLSFTEMKQHKMVFCLAAASHHPMNKSPRAHYMNKIVKLSNENKINFVSVFGVAVNEPMWGRRKKNSYSILSSKFSLIHSSVDTHTHNVALHVLFFDYFFFHVCMRYEATINLATRMWSISAIQQADVSRPATNNDGKHVGEEKREIDSSCVYFMFAEITLTHIRLSFEFLFWARVRRSHESMRLSFTCKSLNAVFCFVQKLK